MATDYLPKDLAPLRFYASVQDKVDEMESGNLVEMPSPAIPGRTDIVLVMFSRTDRNSASGFIVRNKGRYSKAKSKALAIKMQALLAECELSKGDSCFSFEEGERHYWEGVPDKNGTWALMTEHRTAPRKLAEARKQQLGMNVKTPKGRKGKK